MTVYKMEIFLSLMEIVENGFVYKLKKKNPNITEEEIKEALQKWYLDRPGAELGDSYGEVGDISRFYK